MKASKLLKIFRWMTALTLILLYQAVSAQTLDPESQDKFNEAQAKMKNSDYKAAYPLLLEIVKKSDHIASLKMLGDINKDYYKNYSAALTYYKKVQAIIKSKLLLLDPESNKNEILTLKTINDICKSNEQECLSKGANQTTVAGSGGSDSWGDGGNTAGTNTTGQVTTDDFVWGNEPAAAPPANNSGAENPQPQASGGGWDAPSGQEATSQGQATDAWGNQAPQGTPPPQQTPDAQQQQQAPAQTDAWGNTVTEQNQGQQNAGSDPANSQQQNQTPPPTQQETDAWGDPIAPGTAAVAAAAPAIAASKEKETKTTEASNNFSEENGVYTIKDESLSFKFFERGQVTSYTIFARQSNPGFRLPSPKELKTILKTAKENKNGYNLFAKFQWDDRSIVQFLTNDKFTDTNNEQKLKSYMFMQHNFDYEESSVEWGEMVSIILIRE